VARHARSAHAWLERSGLNPLYGGISSARPLTTLAKGKEMNEDLMVSAYVGYCENLLALRKSGDWKAWHETWDEYVRVRLGLSKSRAKLVCDFAKFRAMLDSELFATRPETPEQVKGILALPQKQWIDTWELVLNVCKPPVTAQNVESAMVHFHIYAHKSLSPEALKAIRVRRAAKTMAEMKDGTELVGEIGGRALGKNWNKAVEVVIDADQARLNEQR